MTDPNAAVYPAQIEQNVKTRRVLEAWLALAALLVLVWCNHLWFQTRADSYLAWYARSGSLIGIMTAVFAMAWGDMDKNVALISAKPADYVRGCLLLISLPLISLGGQIRALGGRIERGSRDVEPADSWLILDALIMLPLLLAVIVLLCLWLVLIAPMQYFVFLLCGALPRSLLRSPQRVIARRDFGSYETREIPRAVPVPQGWWDASLASRPVAITAAFSALLMLVLRALLHL